MYINAFPPGSTIEQVLESGQSTIWFSHRSRRPNRTRTFQINVIRDMGKVDVAHKAAGLSDRLLQKKVGFGWSSETMDANFDVF